MELNPDQVAEQLGSVIEVFTNTLNRVIPIPIDPDGFVESGAVHAPAVALKLHALIGDLPIPEVPMGIAHGFVDAWLSATIVSVQAIKNPLIDVREAARSGYDWLLGQMIGAIHFLEAWVEGAPMPFDR